MEKPWEFVTYRPTKYAQGPDPQPVEEPGEAPPEEPEGDDEEETALAV